MLELPDRYHKMIMVHVLKDLLEKMSSMYEHMQIFSRGKDAIKKNLTGNARNEK